VRGRKARTGIDDAQPRIGRQESCGDQRHARLAVIPLGSAAPRPVLGPCDEADPERLAFDGLTGAPQVDSRFQHFYLQWSGDGQPTGRTPNSPMA